MKKIFLIIIFCIIIAAAFPKNADAAKKFVPSTKKTTTVKKSTASSGSIPAVVRYRSDKLGILFSFSNFSGIESVAYSFLYRSNNIQQGAGGAVRADNNPGMERELLFGTCSTSVCTYHYNLTGARLVLTAKMTNGSTVSKSYRIKTYR